MLILKQTQPYMNNTDIIIDKLKNNLNELFLSAKENSDNDLEEYCDMMYCLLNDPERFQRIYN
jgi:hypothetical protein